MDTIPRDYCHHPQKTCGCSIFFCIGSGPEISPDPLGKKNEWAKNSADAMDGLKALDEAVLAGVVPPLPALRVKKVAVAVRSLEDAQRYLPHPTESQSIQTSTFLKNCGTRIILFKNIFPDMVIDVPFGGIHMHFCEPRLPICSIID